MKRILAIVLMGCLAAAPLSVSAETIVETGEAYEKSEVKTSIEEFFYSYENMDASAEINEIMEEVVNASSLEEVQKYEMDHAAGLERAAGQSANNATYLEMVELLLQRRDIIEKTADVDLKEYQKTLEITVLNTDIKTNEADADIKVLKKWHYSFSPELESAAEDYYKVNLKKESGEWKISNISGLADAIMDESLAELEDEITCGEREGYIEAIAEEYSFDLEASDILEENADKAAELYTSPLNAAVTRATSGYNNTAAISYALKYAITPNSAYADFTGSGGDCTNFISQCLYAGGIKQHTGTAYSGTCWFYKTSTNRSSSWTGASEFQSYVTGSSSKIDISSSNWSSVVPGDIIQLVTSTNSAYHSLFVSGFVNGSNGRSDILICAHTTNRSNVSLAQYYGSSSKVYYHINGSK